MKLNVTETPPKTLTSLRVYISTYRKMCYKFLKKTFQQKILFGFYVTIINTFKGNFPGSFFFEKVLFLAIFIPLCR